MIESPSLEVFKKMCRCCTSACVLKEMLVLGRWLDLMILKVFSNLRFCDSMMIL